MAIFCVLYFNEPRAAHFSDMRGEKEERRKIEITVQKYNGLPYSIGRP